MTDVLPLTGFLPLVVTLLALAVLVLTWRWVLRLFGVVIVPGTSLGIVRTRWVLLGRNRTLPDGTIIALNGEAGYQADTLAPGLHIGLWPWQYEITMVPFTLIAQGQLGVVEVCDGAPLSGRVLGRAVACDAFQDARGFLTHGGQRGPQIAGAQGKAIQVSLPPA